MTIEGCKLSLPLKLFSQCPSPVHACVHTLPPRLLFTLQWKIVWYLSLLGQTAAHLGREKICTVKAFIWLGERTPSPNAELLIQILALPKPLFKNQGSSGTSSN